MEPAETDVLSSESRAIPSRRIVVNDASQLPIDYSTTPGGTIFSTTPGGEFSGYFRCFSSNIARSSIKYFVFKFFIYFLASIKSVALRCIRFFLVHSLQVGCTGSLIWLRSKECTFVHATQHKAFYESCLTERETIGSIVKMRIIFGTKFFANRGKLVFSVVKTLVCFYTCT